MIYLIFPHKLVYLTYKLMTNLKIYHICHNLITYFVTLTSPKKSHLGLIFRTGGSIFFSNFQNHNFYGHAIIFLKNGILIGGYLAIPQVPRND